MVKQNTKKMIKDKLDYALIITLLIMIGAIIFDWSIVVIIDFIIGIILSFFVLRREYIKKIRKRRINGR